MIVRTEPPFGLNEIHKFYGDPAPFMRVDGTVKPAWERLMVRIPLVVPLPLGWNHDVLATHVRVHGCVASEVERLFKAWDAAGLWPLLTTYDGGYHWRMKRGSTKLSMHSFGGALDFNAATNQMGMSGDMDRNLVAVAESLGWCWGGRFMRPDFMHFQWARGY